MASQEEIDALTAELGQVATDLQSGIAAVQTEIDNLASQGVNVTNLKAAADSLDPLAQRVGSLTPTPAPPAPTPPPGPAPGPTPTPPPPAPGPTPGP